MGRRGKNAAFLDRSSAGVHGPSSIGALTGLKPPDRSWKMVAVLTFFPVTAILHNAIFKPHRCVLNLVGNDYYPSVLAKWASSDPSPWLAMILTVVTYVVGARKPLFRPLVMAFLIAFLPLAIWVWDIPYTGGIVCRTLHDGKSWLHSRHFYFFGALAYLPILYLVMSRKTTQMISDAR
jgi:hypothetical protein